MKNILLVILFIGLIILSIFGVPHILRLTLGTEQPIMTVISGSMWPKLSRGDIVFVKETTRDEIEIGSVIVFQHENGLAVHRVVNMTESTITTKGDANSTTDEPILYSDVVGRIPAIGNMLIKIPWVGHFSLLANPEAGATDPASTTDIDFWGQLKRTILSPLGIIIMIGFPIIILFQDRVSEWLSVIMPMSNRKRKLRTRAKRLQARWGEERTKKALRL